MAGLVVWRRFHPRRGVYSAPINVKAPEAAWWRVSERNRRGRLLARKSKVVFGRAADEGRFPAERGVPGVFAPHQSPGDSPREAFLCK